MKAPHSKHQDVNVESAGFFSVLKTSSRSVALRPSGGYRSMVGAVSSQLTPEQESARLRTTSIRLVGETGILDRGLVRMSLIVVSAAAFTLFVLCWIMNPHL